VSGGVIAGGNAIHVLGNNFSVLYDNCAEWSAVVGANILNGKLNGPGHEWIVHINLPLALPDFD
jgi:hypothetical protein